jgi:hypothetical protein
MKWPLSFQCEVKDSQCKPVTKMQIFSSLGDRVGE